MISRNKALFQGDPSAPFLFNHTLDRPLFEFHTLAQKNKWGIPLNQNGVVFYLGILAFADNYWMFATSPLELQGMVQKWMALLRKHGWNTPTSEMTYATTGLDSQYLKHVLFEGEIIKRTPRKVGFKALGTFITFDVCDDVELDRRIASAWGGFFKFSPILRCKSIPLADRLKAFTKATHSSLLWCAGSWTLRVDQRTRLRGVQRSMIRKMLHFKYRDGETMSDFMHRTESSISANIDRHNVISFDTLSDRAVFRWAGKLVQISLNFPDRLTSLVFGHKDWDWIQGIAQQNKGRQLHGRCLRIWRWERPMYKCLGNDWKILAQDESEWLSRESLFLEWRKYNA